LQALAFLYKGKLELDAAWSLLTFDDLLEMVDIWNLDDGDHKARNSIEALLCTAAIEKVRLTIFC
jgi:hypothetical protein